jgi:hypothetical protein
MKSAPIFVAGALLLSSCLFWPDEEQENPFIGQWKSPIEYSHTLSDSLYLAERDAWMESSGFDFPPNFPSSAQLDSFNAAFSCTAPNCDTVLWVQTTYLLMTQEHAKKLTFRNGVPHTGHAWKYTFDKDSVYQSDSILYLETRKSSWAYRFNEKKDSLYFGDFEFEDIELWVRNTDSLSATGPLADPY